MAGLPVCLLAGRQVSRRAGRQASRMTGWTASKQDGGQAGARAGLQASLCMPIRFIYCTIPLLLHYYVDRRMHCATDLHHPNSTPSKSAPHCRYFYLKFCCCRPVRQQNSKPAHHRNYVAANQYRINILNIRFCPSSFLQTIGSMHL